LTTGLVLVLVAVGAVFDSPGAAAREALRPDVARAAQVPLARVNAWGEVAENTGYLAGPALAGLLLVVVGGFGTVWVAAALFGLSLLVTWFLVPAHLSVRPSPEPYLRSVWDGIRLLLRDSTLRAVTLTAAVIWLFLLPFESVVLNAYLNESGQVVAFGVILAAYAGGAIGGALAYGAIAHRVPTRVALIVALALAGLSLGAFAVLPPVPVMVALALAAGVVTGPINPLCALIVQSRTPERFRGRVIGSYTALALAAGPLGLLAFGPLVDTYGPAAGFAAIGGGLLLAALLAAGAPGLRRLAGSA
jgi:MFS family permease